MNSLFEFDQQTSERVSAFFNQPKPIDLTAETQEGDTVARFEYHSRPDLSIEVESLVDQGLFPQCANDPRLFLLSQVTVDVTVAAVEPYWDINEQISTCTQLEGLH
eukprot:GABV01000983.1.p2 GENE.GABV01000983.1~~GABV01000983.1.p2  ORF type:complete len:106 (-),score=29.79 GABV01000983.1:193-510(-)